MTAIDLRPGGVIPAIRNQGRRPTCTPMAVTALHEFVRILRGEEAVDLAPETIWSHGLSHGTADKFGMWPRDTINAVARAGQPRLDLWPYNGSLGPRTEPEPAASVGSARFTSQHQDLSGSANDLHGLLASGSPVVVVINVSPELQRCDEMYVAEPSSFGGSHSVLCVGALEDPDRGLLFLIRNSWGPNWGIDGYAYVPEIYLTPHMLIAA